MLTRAAKRHAKENLRRHLAAATLEQLQLPWLSSSSNDCLDFRRSSASSCTHRRRPSTTSGLDFTRPSTSRLRPTRPPTSVSVSSHNHDFRRYSSSHQRTPPRDASPGRHGSQPSTTTSAPPTSSSSRPYTLPSTTPTSKRGLATEAGWYGDANKDIPFEGLLPDQVPITERHVPPPSWGWTGTKPLKDDSSIVVIKPPNKKLPPEVRRNRLSGLTGDTGLLHENLYALVKVGRLAQAERVVRRLAEIYAPSSTELLDAHTRYLTGRVESILDRPTIEEYSVMQRWFELDLRGRDSTPNSAILAIMIKASLAVLEGSRLDRSIRRYISIADDISSDTKYDTIASGIFLESEEAQILRLFPKEFNTPVESIELTEEQFREQLDALARDRNSDKNLLPSSDINTAAELRPSDQKGLGLKALKNSLASLYGPSLASDDKGKSALQLRQERIENDVLISAMDRWRDEADQTKDARARGNLSDPMLGSHVYEWIQDMAKILQEDIKRGEEMEGAARTTTADEERLLLAPFLKLADTEKLCAAAAVEYLNYVFNPKEKHQTDRPLSAMLTKIGTACWKEIEMQISKKSLLEKFHTLPLAARQKKVAELMKKQTPYARSQVGRQALKDEVSARSPFAERGNTPLILKIGAKFLLVFMKVAKLPVTREVNGKKITQAQPVAIQASRWRSGKKIGIIRTNQALIDRLKREPVGSFIAKFLPMVVEPRPWTNIDDGAYLTTKVTAVRFRDTSQSQHEYIRMATKRGDMKQTFAGLDVIGKVPWRINRPVFDVLAEAWNTGEPIGELAPENPPEVWPEKPSEDDAVAMRRWKGLVRQAQNERTGFHSQRCYQNFQLEVARAFLNDTFYCPHTVDFRGRAYPVPPYFNHMGADYVRGLFLFARGKELGETGLRWLRIHLSNVYGFDKASLSDREQFATDHVADIIDSASNPLGGKRWWLTAEEPWQCLATCMEIKNALDCPDPTKFVSHLPIQQDGTCNGLQHYAALGGDLIGAQQVNLMPGDKPADIYSAVADMVKEYVREDVKNGHRVAQVVDGKISRKVVKQPVMTNVYGVTYHGARAQVRKQLVDIIPRESLDVDLHHGQLGSYIATLIFKSLSRMFSGAHAIQHWLGECAQRISQCITPEQILRLKSRRAGTLEEPMKLKRKAVHLRTVDGNEDIQFKSTVVWTTPLGMPVVQPYRKTTHRMIRTSLQDIFVSDATASDPVSRRKQLQGFPPNFIHSLDATHMMLSALKCDEIGLQFSSVHDSFWTHAADVPIMNRILRDAFVRMHSEDVIGRLREEFIARYKGCLHYAPINLRSPLGKKIQALRRANGGTNRFYTGKVKDGVQVDELLEESERQRLLNSEDPLEREQGAQMVTPASLLEAEGDPSTYEVGSPTSGVTKLGEINDPANPTTAESQEGDVEASADAELEAESEESDVPGLLHSDETESYSDAQERDIAAADAEAEKVTDRISEEIAENAAEGGAEAGYEKRAKAKETKAAKGTTAKASKTKTVSDILKEMEDEEFEDNDDEDSPPLNTARSFDGGEDEDADADEGDDVDEEKDDWEEEDNRNGPARTQQKAKNGAKKNPSSARLKLYLWVPIQFPAAPERGGFDVAQLKESQYFFS